jgi:hypothetical protein
MEPFEYETAITTKLPHSTEDGSRDTSRNVVYINYTTNNGIYDIITVFFYVSRVGPVHKSLCLEECQERGGKTPHILDFHFVSVVTGSLFSLD